MSKCAFTGALIAYHAMGTSLMCKQPVLGMVIVWDPARQVATAPAAVMYHSLDRFVVTACLDSGTLIYAVLLMVRLLVL